MVLFFYFLQMVWVGYAGGKIASKTIIDAFKSTFNYKSKDIKEELLRSLKCESVI